MRSQFLESLNQAQSPEELGIPDQVPLILVVGGSQGAVAVNKLIRQAAPAWLEAGAWVVHLTGDLDPDVDAFSHPHYIHRPFYDNMAALFQRATLAVSRAGAGTLAELSVTGTPSILIPYPFAAEDHQTYNARVFQEAGAAIVCPQSSLSVTMLQDQVLDWVKSPEAIHPFADATRQLAVTDSADKLASLIRDILDTEP